MGSSPTGGAKAVLFRHRLPTVTHWLAFDVPCFVQAACSSTRRWPESSRTASRLEISHKYCPVDEDRDGIVCEWQVLSRCLPVLLVCLLLAKRALRAQTLRARSREPSSSLPRWAYFDDRQNRLRDVVGKAVSLPRPSAQVWRNRERRGASRGASSAQVPTGCPGPRSPCSRPRTRGLRHPSENRVSSLRGAGRNRHGRLSRNRRFP